MNKKLESKRKSKVERVWYEGNLELGEYLIPQMIVTIFLRSIRNRTIMYQNAFPMRRRKFLSDKQVNYVQYIIVLRDTENLGMVRKDVIKVVSYIGQPYYYHQSYN